MNSANHRHTQFDILKLAKANQPSRASEGPKQQGWKSPTQTAPKHTLNRKRIHSPDQDALETYPKMTKVKSKTDEPRATGDLQLRTVWESPWKQFEKIYDLELAGWVEVAVRKMAPINLVHVRKFSNVGSEKVLHMFRQLQHQNIVTTLAAFAADDDLYVVVEHMSIALEWIVDSPAYPTERQLAALLGQLLNGASYLAEEGFAHGSLSCSNILLNPDGTLKIASQECCHSVVESNDPNGDLRALSFITMELMQKYVKEDGTIGIDNLERWHSSSDAVQFLYATTSAVSAAELLKHPLLTHPWEKESLIGLISLAQICRRGRYKYTPRT